MGTPPDKAIIPWGAMQGIDYYNFLRLFITNVFARIAVPTFFIISGYYFFIKNDSFNYKIYNLKSATKPLKVLIAFTRPLITEFADNLNLKHPLLPTISPYPTM